MEKKANAEAESRCQPKAIHIDKEGEFFNITIQEWCKNLQIKLELTVGYFPEANEIAEKCNRSILERADTIQFGGGLPGSYWKLACICATYLKNGSPSRDIDVTS